METTLSQRIEGTFSEAKKQIDQLERRARASVEEGLAPIERSLRDGTRQIRSAWRDGTRQVRSAWRDGTRQVRSAWRGRTQRIHGAWARAAGVVRKQLDVATTDDFRRLGKRVDEIARKVDRLAKERVKSIRLDRK